MWFLKDLWYCFCLLFLAIQEVFNCTYFFHRILFISFWVSVLFPSMRENTNRILSSSFFPSFLPWCSLFSVYFKIYFYYLKACECICACGWGYTYLCRYFRRFEPLEPLDLKYQVVANILYEYWEPNSGPLKDQYSLLATESLSRSPSPLSVFWARVLYSFD